MMAEIWAEKCYKICMQTMLTDAHDNDDDRGSCRPRNSTTMTSGNDHGEKPKRLAALAANKRKLCLLEAAAPSAPRTPSALHTRALGCYTRAWALRSGRALDVRTDYTLVLDRVNRRLGPSRSDLSALEQMRGLLEPGLDSRRLA